LCVYFDGGGVGVGSQLKKFIFKSMEKN
jgi:hypothetical protein